MGRVLRLCVVGLFAPGPREWLEFTEPTYALLAFLSLISFGLLVLVLGGGKVTNRALVRANLILLIGLFLAFDAWVVYLRVANGWENGHTGIRSR